MVTNDFLKPCTKHTQLWSKLSNSLTNPIIIWTTYVHNGLCRSKVTEKKKDEEEENYIFLRKWGWQPVI